MPRSSFKLTPSGQDLSLTLDIPKAVSPYLEAWHADQQKAGESIEDFCIRQLITTAMNMRNNELHRSRRETPGHQLLPVYPRLDQ